jgi:hypothetical protein
MQTSHFPIWAGFEPPSEYFLNSALFEMPLISKRALFIFSEIKTKYKLQGRQFRAVVRPIETGALFHYHNKFEEDHNETHR